MKEFKFKQRFSVNLPCKPTESVIKANIKTEGAIIEFFIEDIKTPIVFNTYDCSTEYIYCSIIHFEFPPSFEHKTETELVEIVLKSQLKQTNAKLINNKLVTLGNCKGKEIESQLGTRTILLRIFVKLRKVYICLIHYEQDNTKSKIQARNILNSFTIN